MMRKIGSDFLLILLGTIISVSATFGQSFQYQPERPGKFIFDNQLEKCPGVDVTMITKNLTTIVDWVRQNNPVVDQPTGFDALVRLRGFYCDNKNKQENFGIRSTIIIPFNHFYLENGVSCRATGNTAHSTEIIINNPIYFISTQFDEAEFKTDDPPHLKQPLEKARENLRKYYTTAPDIKEIAPGVRLYAPNPGTWFKGSLLVFNPARPEIWIPVTVKEIMEAKMAYYKVKQEIDSIKYEKALMTWAKLNFKPDQVIRMNLYDVIKQDYENFTAEELNLPAYSCPTEECGISTINARGEGRAVVRFNPACWDRSLPVTAVQYMTLQYRPATAKELEDFKKPNGGLEDYVGKFYSNLPLEKMELLIDKR